MALRDRILEGNFSLDPSIYASLELTEQQLELVNEFTNSLFFKYLQQDTLHTEYWCDKFEDEKVFYQLCQLLHDFGIATFSVGMNIAYCELNNNFINQILSEDEVNSLRFKHKWLKGRLSYEKPKHNNLSAINGRKRDIGIVRKGFMKAGGTRFKYDIKYLNKYLDEIISEITEYFVTSTKEVTYEEVSDELINFYAVVDETFSLGECTSDSRGRSIFNASRKVFNPVSHKLARALVVIPTKEKLDKNNIDEVYLSISEIFGYRPNTIAEKIEYGKSCYETRKLPDELHEIIWLSRIYDNLDVVDTEAWTVPLELDVTSSVLTIEALLFNDHTLMDYTNLINDSEIKDAWTLDYASRGYIKKGVTPPLYGSSATVSELWDKAKLTYKPLQAAMLEDEIINGRFKTANDFKEYIISNVKPKETMKVKIYNEEFTIHCNRFNWSSTSQKVYKLFNSSQRNMKKIQREVHLTPDLEQFKRYFVTLLIHNLDSQIADHICNELDWVLPNHDAFLVHPNTVPMLRTVYTKKIMEIYKNRHSILKNYFRSIEINPKQNYDVNREEIKNFSSYNLK